MASTHHFSTVMIISMVTFILLFFSSPALVWPEMEDDPIETREDEQVIKGFEISESLTYQTESRSWNFSSLY